MKNPPLSIWLSECADICREAGALLRGYFGQDIVTEKKADHSPVSIADREANALIRTRLLALAPDIPIIAEEDEVLSRANDEYFWLVDPLDGTRAFLRGEPEFTVNIGLIHQRRPLLGVIYAPIQDVLYYAQVGKGAYRISAHGAVERIGMRIPPAEGLTITRSRSHLSPMMADYLKALRVAAMIPYSSSIKFCFVAEGTADLYLRFGRTMEWDTAAGHAIMLAAGGDVTRVDGSALTYGKSDFENPPFIAGVKSGFLKP